MLHVFLVDEHEVVRLGVQHSIETTVDMDVVGHAETVHGALLRIPTIKPNVAVIGTQYLVGNGVNLCRELLTRCPDVAVLMLTNTNDSAILVAAFLAGAKGVIEKNTKSQELLDSIRAVGSGKSLLDSRTALALMKQLQDGPEISPFEVLNKAEYNILELVGQGLTNRQIAEKLNYSEKTVKNYVSRILTKLGVDSRTQAAVAFVERQ